MDEVSIVKKEVRSMEWAEKIRECQESGLSVQEWCKQNNINDKTYYYHLRKTREKMIEQVPVPICTTSPATINPTIEIHIGKVIVKIADGMSEQAINAVVKALK